MAKGFLYIWKCPICQSHSMSQFTTSLIAQRWCRKHFHRMHKKDDMTGLEPIIERAAVKERKRKNFTREKIVQIESHYLMAFVQTFQKLVLKLIFVQRGSPYEL